MISARLVRCAWSLTLTWTVVSGLTYEVRRGDAAGGPYIATGPGGTGPQSSEASGLTAPASPTGLTATDGAGSVTLLWNRVQGATSGTTATTYNLSVSADGGVTFQPLGTTASKHYVDTSALQATSYIYRVVAATGDASRLGARPRSA